MKKSCCNPSRGDYSSELSVIQNYFLKYSNENTLTNNMVYLAGGIFKMGTNEKEGFPADGEGPIRNIKVNPFYISSYTVTNEDFADFVKDTNYRTDAERYGWSFVFYQFLSSQMIKQVEKVPQVTPWWCVVEGANWYQPEGFDSHIDDRMDHPVVHISWNDAVSYCNWAGSRLPTEAEWEYAARGNLEQNTFPWGNELTPNGEHYCNIWQGEFPEKNTKDDGYFGTAPALSFPPNRFGLYNMSGNVWEWCSDWFTRSHHNKGGWKNPAGPVNGESKVMRGGSYLCHESYCNRYRVAARSSNTPNSSAGNLGFRCVKDI